MQSEWQHSEGEKRAQIVESLRGPVATAITTLRSAKIDVTVTDLLDSLEVEFCSTDSGKEVLSKYQGTRQMKGEKHSTYINRAELLLQLV